MLGDKTAWWAMHHSSYPLPNLTDLPIYTAFREEEEKKHDRNPESGDSDDRTLTCDRGNERETLRKDKGVWVYEKRFREAGSAISITMGMNDSEEWGEIEICPNEEVKSYEKWRLSPSKREFERFSLRNFTKRGTKSGQSVHFSGLTESWNETYSESPSTTHSERMWERGDFAGTEKTHQEGDISYGELTVKSPSFSESKTWHRDSEHYWGVIQGSAEGKTWSERWDIGAKAHFEERFMQENGKKSGLVYERKGTEWRRQEWEGMEMNTQEMKSGEHSQILQLLEEIRSAQMTQIMTSEEVLKQLLKYAPSSYSLDTEFLLNERQRLALNTMSDIPTAVGEIKALQTLLNKQETLKGTIVGDSNMPQSSDFPWKERLGEVIKQSLETLRMVSLEEIENEGSLEEGKIMTEKSLYDSLLNRLLELETRKSALIKDVFERVATEQTRINTTLQQMLPDPAPIPTLPTLPHSTLTKSILSLQDLTSSLVRMVSETRADEGWEEGATEGMDTGLAEVRTKLTSMVRPFEASHPELATEIASLNQQTLTPQRLLSVVELLTKAVTANQPPPSAITGLISLVKPQQEVEYEEVEEVVEVTEDEQIQEMIVQIEDMENRLHVQEDQITGLKKQLVTKDRQLQAANEELKDLRRSVEVFDARDEELTQTKIALKQSRIELSDKILLLQQTQTTCAQLEKDAKLVTNLQQKVSILERENASLQHALESLQRVSQPSEVTSQLKSLRDAAKLAEDQLKTQNECISKLTANSKIEHEKRNKQLLLRLVSAISGTLKTERTRTFLVWKVRSEAPISDWDYRDMRKRPSLSTNLKLRGDDLKGKWILEADLMLKKRVIEENELITRLDKSEICTNSLLELSEMYEFMETALNTKFTSDLSLLEQEKTPKSVSSYLLDLILQENEGNKHLADEFLSRFLSTLYSQYRLNAPMAVLYSRLLGLFHSNPVILPISVLYLKFNAKFNDFSQEKFIPQPGNRELLCGKAVSLDGILAVLGQELAADASSFEWFLSEMKPRGVKAAEYVCELGKFYAKSRNMTEIEYFWTLFNGKSKVNCEEFGNLAGNLAVSKEILVECFEEISENGEITKDLLSSHINSVKKQYPTGIPITKSEFLSGILSGCEASLQTVLSSISNQVKSPKEDPLSEAEFSEYVRRMSSDLDSDQVEAMYREAGRWSEDGSVRYSHVVGVVSVQDRRYTSPFRLPLALGRDTRDSQDPIKSQNSASVRLRSALKYQGSRSQSLLP